MRRALSYYGGDVLTHSLESDSPAVDKGEDDFASLFDLAIDQNGFDRIVDFDGVGSDHIDIGAVELALENV
jgi:hypothetical protein